jgi:hypothetical protein
MNDDTFPLFLLLLGPIVLLVYSLISFSFIGISISLLFIFIIFLIDSRW